MSEKDTIVRYTLAEIEAKLARGEGRTRPDAPEAEPLPDSVWKNARIVDYSRGVEWVRLELDVAVVDWFHKQGDGHLARMSDVLRSYVEERKSKG